jgi:predicted phosphodiesterase
MIMSNFRVAVISDIHGNSLALSSVLKDIEDHRIEKIIVAGDSTGPTNQNQVFKTLCKKRAVMIRGNGENRITRKNRNRIKEDTWKQESYAGNRWVYNDLETSIHNFLEFLPEERVIELRGKLPLRIVHGSPNDKLNAQGILHEQTSHDSQRLQRVFNTISIEEAVKGLKEPVLICGHTHRPWVRTIEDILVVNPGSVGNPCNGDPRSDYAILTWKNNNWNVVHRAISYNLDMLYTSFQKSGIFEEAKAFALAAYYCRMTGIDVTLMFLNYVKDLQNEGILNYSQAYSAASKSFDWGKYTVIGH